MAKMNTTHRYIFDAAPATLFRARNAAPVTATANSEVVELDTVGGYWNVGGELADETLAVIVNVTALDATTGDETVTFTVKATNALGTVLTEAVVGAITVDQVGQYVFPVDVASIKQTAETFGGLVITATLAGTTPSVTYHAWMGQIKGA